MQRLERLERYYTLIREWKDDFGLIEASHRAKNKIKNELLDELLHTEKQLTNDEKISKIITILHLMRT